MTRIRSWAEVDRDRFKVTPEVLAGDERAAAWRRIVAEASQFGKYETRQIERSRSSG